MLNSLVHGDALFEILIESGNPYADGPLTEEETSRLKAEGLDPATLQALVIGRVVMGGRAVWALTPSHVILLGQTDRRSVDRIERAAITHAEREKGRYGDTVRLKTTGGSWSMYGVDAARAQRLVQQLPA
ncbi:MAG: hypothetical protein ACKODU_04890 [Limnohabitans sp.]